MCLKWETSDEKNADGCPKHLCPICVEKKPPPPEPKYIGTIKSLGVWKDSGNRGGKFGGKRVGKNSAGIRKGF